MSEPQRTTARPHPQLDAAKKHLSALISFDTVSKNSNRALIDHMVTYFEGLGAAITLLPDETGQKANLVARFGPDDQPGVVLSGHTDVVPANEDSWITSPFAMDERDGRLYGRGSCDMKGFAACIMAVAPALAKAKLNRPAYLCFSYDEEVGCLGAPDIAEYLAALEVPPNFAIIGEPSDMRLITGQKGKIAMRVVVKGTSGHSSFAPRHVNAVEYAGRVLNLIEARAAKYAEDGPFDTEFTVPHATFVATMISGGVATNVTPDQCSFTFELRSIGKNNPEHEMAAFLESTIEIEEEMQARAPDTGFEWQRLFAYPAMNDARNSQGFHALSDLMPEYGGKVSFGSEGGVFEKIGGIPSVIIGPGSIEQAHMPNEFVEITQIEACLEFLDRLALRLTEG
tara:strand:- start:74 stop:1267 length:1194 start_codon:yes stop_codon:yes gene_type:complete